MLLYKGIVITQYEGYFFNTGFLKDTNTELLKDIYTFSIVTSCAGRKKKLRRLSKLPAEVVEKTSADNFPDNRDTALCSTDIRAKYMPIIG